jgi:hypothetical protein
LVVQQRQRIVDFSNKAPFDWTSDVSNHTSKLQNGPKACVRVTVQQILQWAVDHVTRAGQLPSKDSGQVNGTDETWSSVNYALQEGLRGLPSGTSFAKLLAERLGTPNHIAMSRAGPNTSTRSVAIERIGGTIFAVELASFLQRPNAVAS